MELMRIYLYTTLLQKRCVLTYFRPTLKKMIVTFIFFSPIQLISTSVKLMSTYLSSTLP